MWTRPPTSRWGQYGWTPPGHDAALKRYDSAATSFRKRVATTQPIPECHLTPKDAKSTTTAHLYGGPGDLVAFANAG
jgi:hypothetical protein